MTRGIIHAVYLLVQLIIIVVSPQPQVLGLVRVTNATYYNCVSVQVSLSLLVICVTACSVQTLPWYAINSEC